MLVRVIASLYKDLVSFFVALLALLGFETHPPLIIIKSCADWKCLLILSSAFLTSISRGLLFIFLSIRPFTYCFFSFRWTVIVFISMILIYSIKFHFLITLLHTLIWRMLAQQIRYSLNLSSYDSITDCNRHIISSISHTLCLSLSLSMGCPHFIIFLCIMELRCTLYDPFWIKTNTTTYKSINFNEVQIIFE